MERELKSEKNQTNKGLGESLERAKNAEINLLEFKLKMGLTLCERALQECEHNIKQGEEVSKRWQQQGPPEVAKLWVEHVKEWQKNREKLKSVIGKAKVRFPSLQNLVEVNIGFL